MPIAPGRYALGPDDAELLVHTRRSGAAAVAGHDLVIVVTSWQGALVVGESPEESSVTLSADATSLRVREGTGGMQALDDGDMDNIRQTIDDEVLRRGAIEFRSDRVEVSGDGQHLKVDGTLTVGGTEAPLGFELAVGPDGGLTGTATVKQTDWGIKPYSALFGALKVADEVEVSVAGALAPQSG